MAGDITFGGIVSGLDTNAIIDALLAARRAPITRLEQQAEQIYFEKQALQRVNSYILALQKATLALRMESTFRRKKVASSNEALVSATAAYGALNRSYSIEVSQMARGARAVSGLNDRSLNRAAAQLMNGNTAGITTLTATSSRLGGVRATSNTLITDTLQAGEGSAAITAGDTIAIAGVLKDGTTSVSGTFTFAGNSTDTIQRLANTIQSTFQGEVNVALGRDGQLILVEANPAVAGNITLSSLTFNDADYSGSTLSIGVGNSYAGGAATANIITGTKTFTTGSSANIATSATLIQDLDQVTGTLDSGADEITITGTDSDGTAISGYYQFTTGDTLNELLTAINGLYTGAVATIQNGKIVLTDTATGTSQTSLNLAFVDHATNTNTFDTGILLTAVQGTSSTAQRVHTTEFTTAAKGKHLLTVTDGQGGQITGTVSLDADTQLAALGVTEAHLLTIDIDSGASGVVPIGIRGLNEWDTVRDLIEAVNIQVPGVTAGLTPDGSGQYYIQITSNTGGKDIRLTDGSGNGILENVFNPTGGTDTDYTTTNATTATTDFTMVNRYIPANNSGEQRFVYTGAEGSPVTTLIGNFQINGGASNTFTPGVAVAYTVEDSQLNLRPATDSHIIGASGVSNAANTQHPPLNIYLSLSQAGFATTPQNQSANQYFHTDGFFTINGVRVNVGNVDTVTVNDVMAQINSSGAGVIAEYDATADRFILRRNNPGNTTAITAGGASDTSNFLTIAGLTDAAGADSFTGTAAGAVNLDTTLSFSGFTLPPSAGTFTINGVTLYVDPTSETLRDLITKINNSAAGVEAAYDAAQDKIVLFQNLTENPGFDQITIGALSDTSNILSSFRLTNSVITPTAIGTVRQAARFTIDGQEYVRNTNTVADIINDVTLNLNGPTGSTPVSVTISQDPDVGVGVVTDFVVAYNKVIESINPAALSDDDRTKMAALSDSERNSMTAEEIDTYENTRQSFIETDYIQKSDVVRRLNNIMQSAVFDRVTSVQAGKLDRLSGLGIRTWSVGAGVLAAKDIPYLIDKTTDRDTILDRVTNNTSVKDYILSKADEVYGLFASEYTSSTYVQGNLDLTSGSTLNGPLRFRIGDGTTYATVELTSGYKTQSQILSAINGALNTAGLISIMQASVTTQGYLRIDSSVDSGRARIHVVDLNAGAQLDESLGLNSGNTYGNSARTNAGLARRIDADLGNFTGYQGFINERIRSGGILDRRLLDIAKGISDMEDRLSDYETSLRRTYANMELALSRFQTTSQYIAQRTALLQSSTGTSSS